MWQRLSGWHRRLAVVGVAALLMFVVFVALTVRWFLAPSSASPDRVDAVVVLAGGEGERRERALALMDEGVADTLVVSVGNKRWSDWPRLAPLCDEPQSFAVICVEAVPDTTAGEAATVATLGAERNWTSIALVTSEVHLHRATVRFDACFAGEVEPVGASAGVSVRNLVHEWLGTIEAQVLDRGC